MLGPGVHFLASFLVDKRDGDILGEDEKDWVSWVDELLGRRSEDDPRQNDDFCFAGHGCRGVLAGSHGKEKSDCDVGHYRGGRVSEGIGGKARGLEQELSARNMDGWQTADACHEGQLTIRVLYSDH